MKQLLLSLLFVGVVSFSFAGNSKDKTETQVNNDQPATITGQVTDRKTNESLVGVKIMLEGTDKIAYTDFDGKYSIENVVPGDYKLTASFISYNQTTEKLRLAKNKTQVNFSLNTLN